MLLPLIGSQAAGGVAAWGAVEVQAPAGAPHGGAYQVVHQMSIGGSES